MSSRSAKHCLGCDAVLQTMGEAEQCLDCGGTLVSAERLLQLYLEQRDDAHIDTLPLEHVESTAPGRACPGCERPMTRVCLEAVELDYCRGHGFWFDSTELEAVLNGAGDGRACATREGFWRGLLGRFVHPQPVRTRHRRESMAPWFWLKK